MLIQWRALGRGKIAEGSLKRAFERWFKMRTYLRRAFRSGGLMEKRGFGRGLISGGQLTCTCTLVLL